MKMMEKSKKTQHGVKLGSPSLRPELLNLVLGVPLSWDAGMLPCHWMMLQKAGETMQTVIDFIFLGSQITEDVD